MIHVPSSLRGGPIIGVDLNGSRATAVQRRGRTAGTGAPRTVSVRRVDPDAAPDAEEFRRLGEVFARRGFHGRRLAIAVPGPALLLETIELPPPESGAPLDQLARTELATMHRLDPAALTAAAIPLPPTRTGQPGRTLAVGCRRDEIEMLLAATDAGSMQIDHLTAGGLAVAGCTAGVPGVADAAEMVDLLLVAGWRWAELVVRRGGRLVSMRVLPDLGLRAVDGGLERQGAEPGELSMMLDNGPSDEPSVDPEMARVLEELVGGHAERLAAEARRSLAYVEQEYGPPGRLTASIVGEGVACPGLSAAFVACLTPTADAAAGAPTGDPATRTRVAAALAEDAVVTERGVAA